MKNIFLILPKEKKLGANPKKQNELVLNKAGAKRKSKTKLKRANTKY